MSTSRPPSSGWSATPFTTNRSVGPSMPSSSDTRSGYVNFARRRLRNSGMSGTRSIGYGGSMRPLCPHAAEWGHDATGPGRAAPQAPSPRRPRGRRVAGRPHRRRPAHPAGPAERAAGGGPEGSAHRGRVPERIAQRRSGARSRAARLRRREPRRWRHRVGAGRARAGRRHGPPRAGHLMGAVGQTSEARHQDRGWLTRHLAEERHEADRLGETREVIFGAQDGVASILIVVITVATATTNSYAVLVAGIAAAMAEVISMAAGEYMSSRSQREIGRASCRGRV